MSELEAASAVEQAEPVTPDAIMQLGLAFWGSKTRSRSRTRTRI